MHIRNLRPYALEIAATGQLVEPGEIADVDPDLGASLLEQPDNWGPPRGTPSVDRPANSAGKAKWVEYATAHGMASDEAEGSTRDELVALFPDPNEAAPSGEEA
jgi:hypothetical protein